MALKDAGWGHLKEDEGSLLEDALERLDLLEEKDSRRAERN